MQRPQDGIELRYLRNRRKRGGWPPGIKPGLLHVGTLLCREEPAVGTDPPWECQRLPHRGPLCRFP